MLHVVADGDQHFLALAFLSASNRRVLVTFLLFAQLFLPALFDTLFYCLLPSSSSFNIGTCWAQFKEVKKHHPGF